MFKIDGSEISWLVYADWLEDRGINSDFVRSAIGDWYFYNDNELNSPVIMSCRVGERAHDPSHPDCCCFAGCLSSNPRVGSHSQLDIVGPNQNGLGLSVRDNFPGTPTYIGREVGY